MYDATVTCLKSKLRDIKMILFETVPHIVAFVATNLKTPKNLAANGYT